jgi:hypothetical protein
LWAFAYALGYVALIHRQDESPVAWWYVALVAGGVVALGGVAAATWGRSGLVVGVTVLAVASLFGVLTIGLLLIPAVVATVIAIALPPNGTDRSDPH